MSNSPRIERALRELAERTALNLEQRARFDDARAQGWGHYDAMEHATSTVPETPTPPNTTDQRTRDGIAAMYRADAYSHLASAAEALVADTLDHDASHAKEAAAHRAVYAHHATAMRAAEGRALRSARRCGVIA